MKFVKEEAVDSIINKLKNKTSRGIDGISNQILKIAKAELLRPITFLVNQMIQTGTYPQQLKIAKVTPIFKANAKEQFSITDRYHYYHLYLKYSKVLSIHN